MTCHDVVPRLGGWQPAPLARSPAGARRAGGACRPLPCSSRSPGAGPEACTGTWPEGGKAGVLPPGSWWHTWLMPQPARWQEQLFPNPVRQQSPTFLAPRTSFMENNFFHRWGVGWWWFQVILMKSLQSRSPTCAAYSKGQAPVRIRCLCWSDGGRVQAVWERWGATVNTHGAHPLLHSSVLHRGLRTPALSLCAASDLS